MAGYDHDILETHTFMHSIQYVITCTNKFNRVILNAVAMRDLWRRPFVCWLN